MFFPFDTILSTCIEYPLMNIPREGDTTSEDVPSVLTLIDGDIRHGFYEKFHSIFEKQERDAHERSLAERARLEACSPSSFERSPLSNESEKLSRNVANVDGKDVTLTSPERENVTRSSYSLQSTSNVPIRRSRSRSRSRSSFTSRSRRRKTSNFRFTAEEFSREASLSKSSPLQAVVDLDRNEESSSCLSSRGNRRSSRSSHKDRSSHSSRRLHVSFSAPYSSLFLPQPPMPVENPLLKI